jgi:hypothetical protein
MINHPNIFGLTLKAEDEGTTAPTAAEGDGDGYLGVAIIDGTARIYFTVNDTMYYIDGTAAAVPSTGNPMPWLFYFTYTV